MLTAGDVDVSAAVAWAAGISGPVTAVVELVGGMTSTMLALTTSRGDVVLRLVTREPWRTHGEGLTTRESQIQEMLADDADTANSPVPAPRSLALDAGGSVCGYPAHLMTRLPGCVDVDLVDTVSLGRLADVLVAVHDVKATIEVRGYQSWAWEAKFQVPSWATNPWVWEEAFALLRSDPPRFEPRFIHRDFQLRNVLWHEEQVSGVVDWVETSIGPAWLDVAHCCTNIALVHGNDAADRFADAYIERTGREAQPYFDVMDVVGFLPPPGRDGFFKKDAEENRRLEERLSSVMP